MEIFDKDGKSQIDGKTIKKVFHLWDWDSSDIIIAFTDKSYLVLPNDSLRKGSYPSDPISPTELMNNLGNNSSMDRGGAIKRLIDAGIYSDDEIKELTIEANKKFLTDIIERIGVYKRETVRLEGVLRDRQEEEVPHGGQASPVQRV